jgi:hypothetical protein
VNGHETIPFKGYQSVFDRLEAGRAAFNERMRTVETVFAAQPLPGIHLVAGQNDRHGNIRRGFEERLDGMHQQRAARQWKELFREGRSHAQAFAPGDYQCEHHL